MNNESSGWTIRYWHDGKSRNDLEKWLDSLTKDQLKSIAKEMKLLELCGNQLRLPHSKPLKKGLFELRERQFGYRIYYTLLPNKVVLMLHGGNKHTQERDIEIARQRLEDVYCK